MTRRYLILLMWFALLPTLAFGQATYPPSGISSADIQSLRDQVTAAQATANSANTAAQSAQTVASSANTKADTAQSMATTASTNAQSAQTAASNAVSTANSASTTASSANTKADNAVTAASTASSTAGTANTTASNAASAASTASTKADTATTTANTANTNASTALSTAQAAATAAAGSIKTINGTTPNASGAVSVAIPTASTVAPPCISDAGAAGTAGTMQFAPFNHTHCSKARRIIATTATDGTYTFNYSAMPFSSPPVCTVTAQVAAGVTDVVNAQIVGTPTVNSAVVLANRAKRTTSALINLTVLESQPTPGATSVHIICIEP